MSKKDKLNTDQTALPEITPESINMPSVTDVAQTSIGEDLLTEEETLQAVEEEVQSEEDDLNKKNYVKITPTFYVQTVKNEDPDDETELFKILNPVEGTVETRELNDEEKHDIVVHELKESRINFRNTTHEGNKTKTQFDAKYKQKRKRKNTLTKKSRKANR